MTIRDIEENLQLIFNSTDKDREIDIEKYNRLVEIEYINCKRNHIENINPKLEEEYKKLEKRTKKVNGIHNISIIINGKQRKEIMKKELYNFLVIEDSKGPSLCYNLSTGEDNSFDFKNSIALIMNQTSLKGFYSYNEKDFQNMFNIGYMKTIKLYKNAKLINSYNNRKVNISDYVEFIDKLGNKFYLDVLYNRVYTIINNYILEKLPMTKETILFEFGKPNEIKKSILKDSIYVK